MIHKSIYISTKTLVYCGLAQGSLDDVINEIRSGKHRELIAKIRNEPNKDIRTALKLDLSTFFPNVLLGSEDSLDEHSIPSGIVQFDIDLKDNIGIDVDAARKIIYTIPETIYCFTSPSGGLKFGLLTDFHKREYEEHESLRTRFPLAYNKTLKYVLGFVPGVEFDASARGIKLMCYLSHDPEAFYNPACAVLGVDDGCDYHPLAQVTYTTSTVSESDVATILEYIPRNLRFADRRNINFAVFRSIGASGIWLLMAHWTHDKPDKLRKQLEAQLEYRKNFLNFGYLVNQAKRYGYVPTGPRAINKKAAQHSDYVLPPLLSCVEATEKVKDITANFFSGDKSICVNVSAGLGKTHLVIEALRNTPSTKKILFLVATHELAEEIKERFRNMQVPGETFRSKINASQINHIKGKSHMCEDQETFALYEKAGIPMPVGQCLSCYHNWCAYTAQFDHMGNIRVMTHEEFLNTESAWFYGTKYEDGCVPRKGRWVPDFIIVDEDFLKVETSNEKMGDNYQSIRKIIASCLDNGLSLEQSIGMHAADIITDHLAVSKNEYIKFTNANDYIKQQRARSKPSKVLDIIYDYVIRPDLDKLKFLRFDKKTKSLILCRIKPVAKRFSSIPVLYLDATANESIVRSVCGPIDFYNIQVSNDTESNIYQLENANYSKNQLTNPANLDFLVSKLKNIMGRYPAGKVGLITYKNIPGTTDFYQELANRLDISDVGYFGNLRGLNRFEDLDCLLVVGRHMIPLNAIEVSAMAVYGVFDIPTVNQESVPVPFRMKDGTTKTIENSVYFDDRLENAKKHFSSSETIQAIGRGRLIRKPKDVYVFSKESLGSDIEVTGFFRLDKTKYHEAAARLHELGYCEDKPRALMGLGLTRYAIEKDKDTIDAEFLASGITKKTLYVKNKNWVKSSKTIYVSGNNYIATYLRENALVAI